MNISIIIPVYNRKDLLKKCLDSISKQHYKDFEVILIDNGSSDGAIEFIKEKYPFIKIIENKENYGPPYARNQGILVSKGDYILFLDNDTEFIRKDTLANMMKIIKKDKNVGAVGGELIMDGNNNILGICGRNFKRIEPYAYLKNEENNKNLLKKCDYFNTSNILIKKDILYSVGGFDPYYFCGHEDTDIGFRIGERGYKHIFGLNTGVKHVYSNIYRLNQEYIVSRGNIRFCLKNKNFRSVIFIPFVEIWDWFKTLLHYSNLAPIIRKIRKKPLQKQEIFYLRKQDKKNIRKYLLTKHYALIKAIIWNLIHFKETLYSKNKNYLSSEVMGSYRPPLF